MCSFITPLEGMEADEHRKPEVGQGPLQLSGTAAVCVAQQGSGDALHFIDLLEKVFPIWNKESSLGCGVLGLGS